MGKLVVQMQLSIDGYVARSRDEDFSWISVSYTHLTLPTKA